MGVLDRFRAAGRALLARPSATGQDSTPASASPAQRGALLGYGPGVLTSDHFNELQHFKSWVFVGVDAIGKQWEQAEWNIFDSSWQDKRGLKSKSFDGPAKKRTPAKGHPVDRLLKHPNEFKSRREFMYQVACQLRLTGGCLIWDVRDQFNEPNELWVIPRGWLWPMPPSVQHPMGGWRVTPVLGRGAGWYQAIPASMVGGFFLDYRETIQVYRSHPLYPGEAMSPLEACSQLLDIMFQTDTATWASFVNSIKPSVLISIMTGNNGDMGPIAEPQVEQIKQQLLALYSGASNAGKAVIANNVQMAPFQAGPSELDYVNGRDQNRNNTLAIQNVPPIAVGLDSDGTYSGSAAKLNQFAELAIQPDLSLFADKVTHRFAKLYGDDFEVEGKAKRHDDPDLTIRKAQLFVSVYGMRRGDVRISENEARAAIDLEPIDGGDVYPVPKEQVEQQQAQAGMAAAGGPGGGKPIPAGVPDPTGTGAQPQDADPFDLGVDFEPDAPDADSTGTVNPARRTMPAIGKALHDAGTNGHALNGHGGH